MNRTKYLLLSVVIIGISIGVSKYLQANKKERKLKSAKVEKTVFTQEVLNSEIPIIINEKGSLNSRKRVNIFSEVQGVLKESRKEFRVGVAYRKGEVLLNINSDEHEATLKAQKSVLQNLIVSIIPDLRLDYPDSFEKWDTYLRNFSVDAPIQPLPAPNSAKEKYFITAKNIYTNYYNIKNLEVRLEKYHIRAPFNGVITEANVYDGDLIRTGQKMGEFINTEIFELRLAVNASLIDDVRIGKKVRLTDLGKTIEVTGKVIRISGKIDTNSQTFDVFVQVSGKNLREGMYLEAEMFARNIPDSYEVSRELIFNKNKMFVFKDSILDVVTIEPIYYKKNTVIVKGLPNGTALISKPVGGAYAGMPVKRYQATKAK